MPPQDGVGGGTPRPRKLSPASARIAPPIVTEETTMMYELTLGSTWRNNIRSGRAQTTRAGMRQRRVVGRDQRRKDGGHNQDHDHDQRDRAQRLPPRQQQGAASNTAPLTQPRQLSRERLALRVDQDAAARHVAPPRSSG